MHIPGVSKAQKKTMKEARHKCCCIHVTTYLVRVHGGRPHVRNILLRKTVISDYIYCCMVVEKLITKISTHSVFVVAVVIVVVFRLLRTYVLGESI